MLDFPGYLLVSSKMAMENPASKDDSLSYKPPFQPAMSDYGMVIPLMTIINQVTTSHHSSTLITIYHHDQQLFTIYTDHFCIRKNPATNHHFITMKHN
jgi:amino acid permease